MTRLEDNFSENNFILDFRGKQETSKNTLNSSHQESLRQEMLKRKSKNLNTNERIDKLFNYNAKQIKKELRGTSDLKFIQRQLTKYLIKTNRYLFKDHFNKLYENRKKQGAFAQSEELMKKSIKQRKVIMKLAKNNYKNK